MSVLRLHRDVVRPHMIDYNGHLNEGWYVIIFCAATDALYDHIGADATWRAESGCSLYTLEAHVRYLREVPVDTKITIATHVLDLDHKRIHFAHEMERNGEIVATEEILAMCVDTGLGRSTVMSDGLQDRFRALCTAEAPDYVGRRIALPGAREH
ncbi:thioesterase family protein [Aquibaculum arenosum]|uniref:Thioesterase family protein n=1 Tax=Aquibaculum arenosum TaxID=3032591 RepID=A0ABT5YJC9_9PROT|nr:thioesterase family protein [Fodinicurvata sp. CAU 1616]MDF2094994.1 thioesterase family protein [Fodinicurvata sp. CAU 1616]